MKKLALFMVLLLAAAACTPELDENQTPENSTEQTKVVFRASFADKSDPSTKVYLNEWKMRWESDDEISIFNKSVDNQEYKVTSIDGTGRKAEFEPKSGNGSAGNSGLIYAVFPYNANTSLSSEGTISLAISSEQTYRSGESFGPGSNVMISVTESEDDDLVFKNACGYLEFKLYGTDIDVTRISLTGKNHEKLAGTATVTMAVGGVPSLTMTSNNASDETLEMVCSSPVTLGASSDKYTSFVLVIPPTSFANGFTITVADKMGGLYTKSTDKTVNIARNQVLSMAPIEVAPVYPIMGVVGKFNDWGGPEGGPKTDLVMHQDPDHPGIWVSPAFKVPAGTGSDDGFKIRKDYVWTILNYGGTFGSFGTAFDAIKDGANIQVSSNQDYMVIVTYDQTGTSPKITVNQVDVWSVTGYFNCWGGDLEMTETSPGVWESPMFDSHPDGCTGNDGFKLRKNYNFAFGDYGGSFAGFDIAFNAETIEGGGNIIVDTRERNHRISVKLNLSANPATITVHEYPEVWSVMGDFNDWTADLDMEESSDNPGIWESEVFETKNSNNGNGFKLRKNHDWKVMEYGIASGSSFPGFDTPFAGVSQGDNIVVGNYSDQNYLLSVTLNTETEEITVTDHSVWSLIGSFNQWTDLDMQKIDNYTWRVVLNASNEEAFKIRKNHNWAYNWGAFSPQTAIRPGEPLSLNSGGENIYINAAGIYEVVLNLQGTMTVTVTKVQQP